MNPIALGVNIDHIATVRQARGTLYPDPVRAAAFAEHAGADSITVHLREDRRHIQEGDVERLKASLSIPLNLEMALIDEMITIASRIVPDYVCLVPEKRQELTTEGGLEVVENVGLIHQTCEQLAAQGIRVSLFIAPDIAQIDAAVACSAPAIELHTGAYADAPSLSAQRRELDHIAQAVDYARQSGLIVNAGHGLHYHNVQPIAALSSLHELNIGHSIVARALFCGLPQAVRDMKQLMDRARCVG